MRNLAPNASSQRGVAWRLHPPRLRVASRRLEARPLALLCVLAAARRLRQEGRAEPPPGEPNIYPRTYPPVSMNALPGAPDFAYRDGALVDAKTCRSRASPTRSARRSIAIRGADRAAISRFAAAFAGRDATICYSVKANPNLAVIATLARLGAGADVVSEGEFRRALAAGMPGSRIVFSGIGKTESELRFALAHEVRQINVESLPELELLSAVAHAHGPHRAGRHPRQSRCRRAHPRQDHHRQEREQVRHRPRPCRATPIRRARAARPRAGRARRAYRLAAHPLAPFEAAFARVAELSRQLRAEGVALERLDLGGGLGIRYRDETPPAIEDYAALVNAPHRQSRRQPRASSPAAPSSAMPACWSPRVHLCEGGRRRAASSSSTRR